MRLLRGELLKLGKRPATRTVFLLVGLAIVMIYVGMGAVAATLPAGEDRDGLAGLLTHPEALAEALTEFFLLAR